MKKTKMLILIVFMGPGRWSEGSLVRRFVGANTYWSEGSLVQKVVGPKTLFLLNIQIVTSAVSI